MAATIRHWPSSHPAWLAHSVADTTGERKWREGTKMEGRRIRMQNRQTGEWLKCAWQQLICVVYASTLWWHSWVLYLGLEAGLIGPLGTRERAESRAAVTAISSANKSSSLFLQHLNTFDINAKPAQLKRHIYWHWFDYGYYTRSHSAASLNVVHKSIKALRGLVGIS